jgi:hypothetical protein
VPSCGRCVAAAAAAAPAAGAAKLLLKPPKDAAFLGLAATRLLLPAAASDRF